VPREPTGPQAGSTLLYHDGSALVYIPAGEFEMGGGGKNNPLHTVSLDGFWIQKTEVTRRMYQMCLTDGSCTPGIEAKVTGYLETDTAYFDRPVVGLKFEQAQNYCAWIGGRLPTEAEWEYAARGTTGSTYPWGNDEPTCDQANINNCVGGVTRATKYQTDKSPFGVLDMAGNVREWVSDYFDGNYYKDSPSQNPTGPAVGNYYVIRGGGFASLVIETSATYRGFIKLIGYEADLGFRCVVNNPVVYAPYCEASQYAQEVQTTLPTDRCEPGISEPKRENQSACGVIGTVDGGKIISIVPVLPGRLECQVTDDQHFTCSGGGKDGYPLTACVTCDADSSNVVPILECPLNYALMDGTNTCEYVGGPVPDYCPPNSIPLNENQCVYQQVQAGNCAMGSYFDEGMQACVTIAQTPRECRDGFNYDFDKACCEEGIALKYPVCGDDEYYSAEYGCMPLPKPEGIESCATSLVFPCY
jgi:formylglycine-generating enzyme required for sulfatase activity